MLSKRRLPLRVIIRWGLFTSGRVVLWSALVFLVHVGFGLDWLRVPFTPLSVMGIAVAFYAGFKNNAAYDRFWEGRKIWGGIVNESRTWANAVLAYVLPLDESEEAHAVRRDLIYRQLAWVNALRLQLRSTSRFHDKPAKETERRLKAHHGHIRTDWEQELSPFIDLDEAERIMPMANSATHLVARQGQKLARLVKDNRLDLFHQIALMETLSKLYTLQGKAERIKKTPFPRVYAEFSRLFTRVFVYVVPFGLLDVFSSHFPSGMPSGNEWMWFITYLFSAGLVGWVFMTMEGLGDASEDPFERSINDVPMNSLCIVIERDLRQLLGEEKVPPQEEPIDGVLY